MGAPDPCLPLKRGRHLWLFHLTGGTHRGDLRACARTTEQTCVLTRPPASVGFTDPSLPRGASPTGRGPCVQDVSRAPLRVALSTRRAPLCLTSPPGSPGLNEVNTGHFWADGLGGLRAGSQGEDCGSVAASTRTGVLLTQLRGGHSSREAQHPRPSAPAPSTAPSAGSALRASRLQPQGVWAPT